VPAAGHELGYSTAIRGVRQPVPVDGSGTTLPLGSERATEQALAYGRQKRRQEHLLATERDAYGGGEGPFVRALLAESRVRVPLPTTRSRH